MKFVRVAITIVIVLAVLAAGIGGAVYMVMTRAKPAMTPPEPKPTLVRAVTVHRTDEQVTVPAMGIVGAAQSVVVQPQVSGRIVEQSPQLRRGGRFRTGDVMLRIDPRDYELAIDQQQAAVERARYELAVERGRQTIARREWELLEAEGAAGVADRELALRIPHLRNAEASLRAAESALARAELDLERTTITAPFNAFVKDEIVDLGQLISPQTPVATLIGTDQFWVDVAVPVDRLGWIPIPTTQGPGGSPAVIEHSTGARGAIKRRGHVLCLCGDVDPVGRMARLLVAVDDPFDLSGGNGGLPLLLGAYVRVGIEGSTLEGVYVVPRTAMHDGDRVWVMDEADRLAVRPVTVAWRREDDVLISGGLEDGDRVVMTNLPSAVPGMWLRAEE